MSHASSARNGQAREAAQDEPHDYGDGHGHSHGTGLWGLVNTVFHGHSDKQLAADPALAAEDLPTYASHAITEAVRHALHHDPCGHRGAEHHAHPIERSRQAPAA